MGRGQRTHLEGRAMFDYPGYAGWHPLGNVLLGCFITLSVFLSATTCYYRKKFYTLKQPKNVPARKEEYKCKMHRHVHGKKHQRQTLSKQRPEEQNPLKTYQAFSQFSNCIAIPGDDEPYQEKYDEHGVRVERQVFGL